MAPRLTEHKLIYEGRLTKRILYIKSASIFTSLGIASSYGWIISQKGFSAALAGVGFVFTPFFISPIAIAWLYKRYITKLYYNPQTSSFQVQHYGLLLKKKSCSFRKEDVIVSDVTEVLNSFKVGKKPFFLHEEDLKDVESVQIYKRMIGLDKAVRDETKTNDEELKQS